MGGAAIVCGREVALVVVVVVVAVAGRRAGRGNKWRAESAWQAHWPNGAGLGAVLGSWATELA